MSNFLFSFLVAFFTLIGLLLVYTFVTTIFTTVYLDLGAALAEYKAPTIVALVFSALFAWVKVSA